MELLKQLDADLTTAILNSDAIAKGALRSIKTALIVAGSAKGRTTEVTNEETLVLIQKQIKQREESAEIYLAQNRQDLYDVEIGERDFLKKYLPTQLERSAIEVIVKSAIESVGASTIKDMGKVMNSPGIKDLAGKADSKTVSEIVKSILA